MFSWYILVIMDIIVGFKDANLISVVDQSFSTVNDPISIAVADAINVNVTPKHKYHATGGAIETPKTFALITKGEISILVAYSCSPAVNVY